MKPVSHTFVSAKSDGGDTTLIRPSNWNATHDGVEVVRKAADEAFSLTTFSTSANLSFSVVANGIYVFEYYLFVTTNAATVGIRIAVRLLTGVPTDLRFGSIVIVDAPAGGGNAMANATGAAEDTAAIATTTGPGTAGGVVNVYGSVTVPNAADTLELRHASETATATTILAGSWGRLTKVG